MTTWRERIVAARTRGRFSDQDVSDAESSWCTCAVGEQHDAMPNVIVMADGRPQDEALYQLGNVYGGFGLAVQRHDFDAAERLLDAIEDRALQLKREQ